MLDIDARISEIDELLTEQDSAVEQKLAVLNGFIFASSPVLNDARANVALREYATAIGRVNALRSELRVLSQIRLEQEVQRKHWQDWRERQIAHLQSAREYLEYWEHVNDIERKVCNTHSQRNATSQIMRTLREQVLYHVSSLTFDVTRQKFDDIPF